MPTAQKYKMVHYVIVIGLMGMLFGFCISSPFLPFYLPSPLSFHPSQGHWQHLWGPSQPQQDSSETSQTEAWLSEIEYIQSGYNSLVIDLQHLSSWDFSKTKAWLSEIEISGTIEREKYLLTCLLFALKYDHNNTNTHT